MKKSILILAMIGFAMQSYAQSVLYEGAIEKEDVPIEVVKAINIDFPDYIIEEFTPSPIHYVDQDVFISSFKDPNFMDS